MDRVLADEALCRGVGIVERLLIEKRVIKKRVESGRNDQRLGQTGVVLCQKRREQGIQDVLRLTGVVLDVVDHGLLGESGAVLELLVAFGSHTAVSHRRNQDLSGDLGTLAVAGEQADAGCEVSACAVAHDIDLIRVYLPVSGSLCGPEEGFVAILERDWEFELRGKSVIYGENRGSGGVADVAADGRALSHITQHPAAVVEEHYQGVLSVDGLVTHLLEKVARDGSVGDRDDESSGDDVLRLGVVELAECGLLELRTVIGLDVGFRCCRNISDSELASSLEDLPEFGGQFILAHDRTL